MFTNKRNEDELVVVFNYIDYLLNNLTFIKKYPTKQIIPLGSVGKGTFHFEVKIEITTDKGVKGYTMQVNYFSLPVRFIFGKSKDKLKISTPYLEVEHMESFRVFLNEVFGEETVNQVLRKCKVKKKSSLQYKTMPIRKEKYWQQPVLH